MLKKYGKMGWKRFYAIFALTDETYSLVCTDDVPDGVDREWYYFLLSMMNHSYWIIGSFIGAFIGNTFEFNSAGVDFSMTALFVVMLVEQWEKSRTHIPALLGGGITLICLIVFGADYFLIPSMLIIAAALLLLKPAITKAEGVDEA